MSNDDILARLQKLEEENRQLRAQMEGNSVAPVKATTTYVDIWKGNPVLRLDGNFRPFGIGLKNASIILECIDAVKMFVEQNKSRLASATDEPADDIKFRGPNTADSACVSLLTPRRGPHNGTRQTAGASVNRSRFAPLFSVPASARITC